MLSDLRNKEEIRELKWSKSLSAQNYFFCEEQRYIKVINWPVVESLSYNAGEMM